MTCLLLVLRYFEGTQFGFGFKVASRAETNLEPPFDGTPISVCLVLGVPIHFWGGF